VDLDFAKSIVEAGEIVTKGYPYHVAPAPSADVQNDSAAVTEDADAQISSVKNNTATSTGPTKFPLPIILAGGLTPSNVESAIAHVHPWAVDVSGGVETDDGQGKDLDKVREFVERVKGRFDSTKG